MPPKKRPAAAGSATSTAKRAKKVSIGGTSIMGEADASETFDSGRPKRASTGEPNYSIKKTRIGPPPTKNPGPKATKTTDTAPLPPVKKPPGRPRKDAPPATEPAKAPSTPTKKRGRPPGTGRKVKSPTSKFTQVKKHSSPHTARQSLSEATKPKSTAKAPAKKSSKSAAHNPVKSTAMSTKSATSKPRGRPKGSQNKMKDADTASAAEADMPSEDIAGLTANESDWDNDEEDDDTQYWLMKAEPDSRIEKGVDVKFSIDDLQAADKPEPWDGVRSPTACKNMRLMKKGDLAFFYHSNCKVPGIVGIMEIAEEHSIDESAFDVNHPYYDPNSLRAKPKWEVVHVKFVRKFSEIIKLSELKSFAKTGGALENLEMVKQSRLSVSAVKPREWRFIQGLVEAEELAHDDDDEENTGAVRGQVLKVSEEVVRDLHSDSVDKKAVNESYGAEGEEEPFIKSKLTTMSMTGVGNDEMES